MRETQNTVAIEIWDTFSEMLLQNIKRRWMSTTIFVFLGMREGRAINP